MLKSKSIIIFTIASLLAVGFILGCSSDNKTVPTSTPRLGATATPKTATATPKPNATPTIKQWSSPPPMTIDPNKAYMATFYMAKGGQFTAELYPKEAPVTVNSFVFLARQGFFDGVTFHRVIPDFVAQGGDPSGSGSGGPGYVFDNEPSPIRRHVGQGVLSMANSGIWNGHGTNGSQFFITYTDLGYLDGYNAEGKLKDCTKESCHTVFGKIISGLDVALAITPRDPDKATKPGDAIRTITIEEK